MESKATQKMLNLTNDICSELNIAAPSSFDYDTIKKFNEKHYKQFTKTMLNYFDERKLEDFKKSGYEITDEFKSAYKEVKHLPGVYFFWNKNKLLYVGKSTNLKNRIIPSLHDRAFKFKVTHFSYNYIDECDVHIEEMVCISFYKPAINTDGKTKTKTCSFKPLTNLKAMAKYKVFK